MNHTLVKDLPHIKRSYNRSRYIARFYKSESRKDIYNFLVHGIVKRYLDETDIMFIYCDADRRVLDEEISVANWIMEELGPVISEPGPVSLSVFFETD